MMPMIARVTWRQMLAVWMSGIERKYPPDHVLKPSMLICRLACRLPEPGFRAPWRIYVSFA